MLNGVDVVVAVGGGPPTPSIVDVVATTAGMPTRRAAALLEAAGPGQAVLADRERPGSAVAFTTGRRSRSHVRHWHKYDLGHLPEERRFHFRAGRERRTGATAGSIAELERHLRSCDDVVIAHHAGGGDFSRWVADVLGAPLLGHDLATVEAGLRSGGLDAGAARRSLLSAIRRRSDG